MKLCDGGHIGLILARPYLDQMESPLAIPSDP
jgi:hypothetical protein